MLNRIVIKKKLENSFKFSRFVQSLNRKIWIWFICGLCLSALVACGATKIDSTESAYKAIQDYYLPKIKVEQALISDDLASKIEIGQIQEPLPKVDSFPLYGATPSNDPNISYIEIFSSAEKASGDRPDERWLVDVAEAFNAKKLRLPSGKVIQVGIRNIPSGLGAKIIASRTVKPVGYTPTTNLWLELLKNEGIQAKVISPMLVPNHAVLVLQPQIYQSLATNGEVNFDVVLDAILAGKLKVGYANPYAGSPALNLLYSLFWRASGHAKDRNPLTISDLQSPQVSSVFDAFQKQVSLTTLTYLDLKQIFIRDPQSPKLGAFLMEYQSYATLKRLSGFEKLAYVPFGVPHSSPLVGFDWNSPEQQESLGEFAKFATSEAMQTLAQQKGFETTNYLKAKDFPPVPSGEVLKYALSFWKQKKDGKRTVYMEIVIDTSGSMSGERIKAVKEGLRSATNEINAGNQVGLITFSNRVKNVVNLAPFDTLQHKRLLAAIEDIQADGETALYDAVIASLGQLADRYKSDNSGIFRLLLLTDGEANVGLKFDEVKDLMRYSDVRIYPIAYGEVNQKELAAIASLRESTVQTGTPKNVQNILKEIFQTNL